MDLSVFGSIAGVVTILAALLRYLDRFDRHLQNQTDLLWEVLRVVGPMADRPEIMNGFLAQSGRVISPLKTQVRAAGPGER